jgi:tRNA(Ile)-lysidine synthase
LLNEKHSAFFLYELLRDYGFNAQQVNDAIESFRQRHTGNMFLAESYRLFVDRDSFIVSVNTATALNTVMIQASDQELMLNGHHYAVRLVNDASVPAYEQGQICLDADLLSFPLTLRPWRHGDRFIPLGMKGSKKISDLLIDEKISRNEKEKIMVIESAGMIAAILDHRPADPFKITASTQRILHIRRTA